MYVGPIRHAEHEATVAGDFRCAVCGFQAIATARAFGHGNARDVLLLDGPAAKQAARRRARNDALNRAEALLRIVPCPRCASRDAAGARAFVLWALGATLGIALVSFMVAGAAVGGSSSGLIVGSLAALASGGGYALRRRALWNRAADDVAFVGNGLDGEVPSPGPKA
jgi:hypothetical protein